MRIEIIGLPGVGKTYILNLLCHKYPIIKNYYYKVSWSNRVNFFTDWCYYYRHFSFVLYSYLQKSRGQLLTRIKRIARRKKVIAAINHCVLIDSGLLQPVIEAYIFFDRFSSKIRWNRLLDESIMDHCYIFINDSIENIVAREMKRPVRRFPFDKKVLTQKYSECQRLIKEIQKKDVHMYEFNLNDYGKIDDLLDNIYKTICVEIEL